MVGLILPVVVTVDLLTDTGCPGHETKPHITQACVLSSLALLAAWAGVVAHRHVARWVARQAPARSKLRGVMVASLTLLPAFVLGLSNAALAAWLYFAYAFHICLSMSDIIPLGR